MKEILIPLNFTTTPTVTDTKQSFSTSDEASGVLTFTTTADVAGTVASLTIRNASENANRQTVLIERLDVNSSPFSYALKNPLPFGQYEGTVLLKKNLTVLASATFLFGVNSSLSAEVLPDLVKAYSLDELVENVETEVNNLKDAFNLTVSETVKGVNKTESTLQAQENVRYLNEHTRKTNEESRIANEQARIAAELERKDTFDTLVDSAVIEQTVAQEVANEFQQIEATYANRLLSTEQQLAQAATKTALNVEKARIDSFTTLAAGSTTGDAELIDGRTGEDAIIYPNIGGAIRGQIAKVNDNLNSVVTPIYTNYFDFDNVALDWTTGYYYSFGSGAFIANASKKCNKKKVVMAAGNYSVHGGTGVEFVCFKNNVKIKVVTVSNKTLTLDDTYEVICNYNSPWPQLMVTEISNNLNITKGYLSETIASIAAFDEVHTVKSSIGWIAGHYLENASMTYEYEPRFICSKSAVEFEKSYFVKPAVNQLIQIIMVQNGLFKGYLNWTNSEVFLSCAEGISYYINLKRADNLFIENTNAFADSLTFNEAEPVHDREWVSGMGIDVYGSILAHFGSGQSYGARLISDYQTYDGDVFISCTDSTLQFNVVFDAGVSSGFLTQKSYRIPAGKRHRLMLRYTNTLNSLVYPDANLLSSLIFKSQQYDTVIAINDRPIGKYAITPFINGAELRNQLTTNETTLTESEAYAHGSSMVIVGSTAYVASIANTQTKAEFDEYVFVRLTVFDINTPTTKTNYVVAAKGIYGAIELQGVCSCVGITANGDNLHIVFYSLVNGEVTELHRAFNITSSVFGDISVCNFKYGDMTYGFTAANIDAAIGSKYSILPIGFEMAMETFSYYNGYWYTWLCSGAPGEFNGMLFKTSDFINYDFVLAPDFRTKADCEIMNYYFDGHLYSAFRRNYSDNSLLVAKFNLTTKKCVDKIVLPDCGSRPNFYEFNNELYLIHSTYVRRNTSIVKIHTTRLVESLPIASIEDFTFNYFSPIVKDGVVYFSYSSSGVQYGAIKFSRFNATMAHNSESVGQKLLDLING